MPAEARVVKGAREVPTWIVTTLGAPMDAQRILVERGVEVLRVPSDANGRVALPEALRSLGARGLTRLFCEGGPGLADALAQADLVDELVLVTGRSARGAGDVPALGPSLQDKMDDLTLVGEERIGPDLFMFWEKP
jgi:diaminohydroxyphosphoribosylaminopyrimidine deaminase / 5-amino-6-(5-phosphoribosylamino)uracil reductase